MLKNYVRIYSGGVHFGEACASFYYSYTGDDRLYVEKKNYVHFTRISSKDRRAHHNSVLSD